MADGDDAPYLHLRLDVTDLPSALPIAVFAFAIAHFATAQGHCNTSDRNGVGPAHKELSTLRDPGYSNCLYRSALSTRGSRSRCDR
jgi:hypothetical protein